MSWGHAALDLAEDADERAVKRAYAARLRTTRPDDDPVAFQQLHQAYQAALDWARHRAHWQDEDEDENEDNRGHDLSAAQATGIAEALPLDQALARSFAHDATAAPAEVVWTAVVDDADAHDPVRILDRGDTTFPPAAPAAPARATEPLPQPAAAQLDPGTFAQRVIAEAQQSEPAAFERWLQLRPELWSLRDKPLIGDHVLHHLLTHDAPICADNFDLLAQCFGWDDVGSGLDPYEANACRLRLHRLWVLQPRNQHGLARYLHRPQAPVNADEARTRLQRLTRPWQPWRALWDAWPAHRVAAMRDTLDLLGVHDADDAVPPLRPAQVAFWRALADGQRLSWPRMQLALLRSALCALVVLAVMTLLGVLGRAPAVAMQGVYAALLVMGVGALLLPLRSLGQWQLAEEHPPVRWPLLRLWLIPLLAIGALLVIHLADARIAGSALAWATLGLSIRRWWHRAGYVFQFNGWLLLGIWPFLKLGGLALMFGEIAVVGALLAWTVDAMTKVVHR